ncbi:hypothetical protein M422DRAFT_117119, partial [Sphaerobolus stellatus SS14]
PRKFSMTGFFTIDSSQLVEEETLPWYKLKKFYLVRIGQVFNSRYKVVGKLGYGAYITI